MKTKSYICETCKTVFVRQSKNRVRRFCSPKCRYKGMFAQGFRPVHNKPHSTSARAKIKAARAKQGPVWNKGKKTGARPWNKGLTGQTSAKVKAIAVATAQALRGRKKGPLSSDTKKKLSEDRKGDRNWAKRAEVRGKISQSVKRLYREHPEILENRKSCGRNQFSGEMSSLEKLIAVALNRYGIHYLHNQRVGRFWADFVILDRVIIECDGRYWHQDAEKERRRDIYITSRGYFVYHIQEVDILANPQECLAKVLRLYRPFVEVVV